MNDINEIMRLTDNIRNKLTLPTIVLETLSKGEKVDKKLITMANNGIRQVAADLIELENLSNKTNHR